MRKQDDVHLPTLVAERRLAWRLRQGFRRAPVFTLGRFYAERVLRLGRHSRAAVAARLRPRLLLLGLERRVARRAPVLAELGESKSDRMASRGSLHL